MEKNLYTRRQQIYLKLLKETREESGLRQDDVAKKLKKPQSFVSKYESGERRLDVLELVDVCKALGIHLHEFAKALESRLVTRRART